MKIMILFTLLSMVILAVPAACGPKAVDGVMIASGATLQSDRSRDKSPDVTDDSRESLLRGNAEFAFDLFRQLNKAGGNLFYSPYSISTALAMTYAGAGGATAGQMASTLHFTLPPETLHPAFNWLERELAKRNSREGGDDEDFRLYTVNAVWGQKDYAFKTAFLDVLAEDYGAGLRILDFIDSPEGSRIAINDWVSGQTEERVRNLLERGSVTGLTRLVLTNAVYFKASWYRKFLKENTYNATFYRLEGDPVIVPMMNQTMIFNHGEGDDYLAVELPYRGEEISMLVLAPKEGKFREFESGLDSQKLADIIEGLEKDNVVVNLPKFQFRSQFSLKGSLSDLGMSDAFSSGAADFSGMSDDRLWLDDVAHQAYVSVDENGTEAAAATAAVIVASLPDIITVDRPFIFLIRDTATGSIIFLGRVLNPLE